MPNANHPCRVRTSRSSTCGGRVTFTTDGHGRVTASCERCERRRRGVCRDCPRPVAGKVGRALRCAACRRLAQIAASEKWKANNRRRTRVAARKYARAHRDERIAYNRVWRAARPEKKRRYERGYRARHGEAIRAYQRAYNARTKDRPVLPRTCVDCPTSVRGTVKRCPPCRELHRKAARRALGARAERAA